MPPIDLEDPDRILEHLYPAIKAVDDALDYGVSLADHFFSDKQKDHDPHVWATIVRFGTCSRLDEKQTNGWRRIRLSFCGIQIVRDPLTLRVLKAHLGGVPYPGKSIRRCNFYLQEALPLVFNGLAMPRMANLLLDWHVDASRTRTYHLSKPNGIWKYCDRPKLEWWRSVEVQEDSLEFVGSEENDLLVESVMDLNELEGSGEEE